MLRFQFHETRNKGQIMFKKSLLALAVAGFSIGANAATFSAGGSGTGSVLGAQLVSAEGAASDTSLDLSAVTLTHTVTNPANYGSAAKIRVTITGATFNAGTVVAATFDSVNIANNGESSFPSSTVLEFDLSKDTDGGIAVIANDTFTLTGLVLTPDAKTSGSAITAKVEVLSSVGGALIDSSSGVVASYVTQFTSTTSKLDATIDVTEDREKFTDGTSVDTFAIITKGKAVDLRPATAVAYKQAYTVYGDFSFLDADGDGKVDSGNSVKNTTDVTFAKDFQSFTFTAANVSSITGAAAQTDTDTFTITTDGKRALPTSAFTASYKLGYKDATATATEYAATDLSLGAWGLNGTTVNVPYIPVGYETLSANLEISNTSAVDGEISLSAVDNMGVSHGIVKLAKVATKKSVTKVSEADIVAAFGLTTGTKLSLDVTVNAPSGITVYPYYRENDVRVSLPTSQYRPVECKTTAGTYAVAGGDSTGEFANTCTAK